MANIKSEISTVSAQTGHRAESACMFFAIRMGPVDRRPPVLPRSRAPSSPAQVCAAIRRLSNWISEEKMFNTSLSDAVGKGAKTLQ